MKQVLSYFFAEVDGPSGFPSLPTMVSEGIALPQPSARSHSLKQLADRVLAQGPPVWHQQDIDNSRYAITDLIDDILGPRSKAELTAAASVLYGALANHYLRSQHLWSAKAKTIPRRLRAVDAPLAEEFEQSFEQLFSAGKPKKVITLTEHILSPHGGWLFEGYTLSVPLEWRRSPSDSNV